MSTAIIFFLYLIIFTYFLCQILKTKYKYLNKIWIVLPFFLKIFFGVLYGKYFSPGGDTWNYFNNGITLINNKLSWNSIIKYINDDKVRNFNILSSASYFNYYRYKVMDLLSAVISLTTGGNYYTNIIIYNWLTILGIFKIFDFIKVANPSHTKILYWIIFYYPPFLFWTSGYHRDGLCISFLGFALTNFRDFLDKKESKSFIYFSLFTLMLCFLRSYMGISLLIGATLWGISKIYPKYSPIILFRTGFFLTICLFFSSALLPKEINLPYHLASKQYAFFSLQGNSRMPLDSIKLNPLSYIKASSQAIQHLLIAPSPFHAYKNYIYIIPLLQNILFLCLIILLIVYQSEKQAQPVLKKPENNILILLVVINYLIIGLTVPFLGAILRYKSPFELLLFCFVALYINPSVFSKRLPHLSSLNFNA